ncbi:nucleoside hydrolase [Granulicella sp. S156]|uniref:nucleoside hydrolase n=1 Tax=Granulicella sp. S156 TaxID=1747224 RepID=UPI00131D0390|nr:nucleoside hydrolase [Granulicella sp. S156]
MNPNIARKILIDTDTASDDAVALIMALRSPDVSVQAITVVAGNVSVEQGTRNALYTVELCGASVPVFSGAAAPLIRPLEDASWFHGRDGLGDQGYQPKTRVPEDVLAVDAIVRTVEANPGIEIITLGPLTNLALALRRRPDLASSIGRCVVMGGAPCCEGNVTPSSEYNFWVDPEAARIVLRSRLPIELVGWQLSRGAAVVSGREIEEILALKTRFGEFAIRSNETAAKAYLTQTGEEGIALPDPTAMAILLDPSLSLVASAHYMDVQVDSGITRGMSVIDKLGVAEDARNRSVWSDVLEHGRKHTVIWEMDISGWKQALLRALR